MAIVINGSGTVTGISVGGLPDGIVDSGTLATNSVDSAEIADNAVGLAQMAGGTDGNIITYDTSGNPVVVATGSDGQILTSAGAGAVPAFEAAPGGGKIIGYQYSTDGTIRDGTAGSEAVTGLTFSYTPSAVTSRLFVTLFVCVKSFKINGSNNHLKYRVRTGTTTGGTEMAHSFWGMYESEVRVFINQGGQTYTFIHHPNTTSAQDYCLTVQNAGDTGNTWMINDYDAFSTFSVLEIDGS